MWQNLPTVFPPITNRESVTLSFYFTDDDTGEAVDLTGFTFVFEMRYRMPTQNVVGSGYSPYYDIGNYDNSGPVVRRTSSDGIEIVDVGRIEIDIPLATMRSLSPGTYEVGMTVTNDDATQTQQILIGTQAVLFGGVT